MKSTFRVFAILLALTACTPRPIPWPEEDPDYCRTLLKEINLYRMENSLHPLRLDPLLVQIAGYHSAEMFQKQKANHRNFDDRLEQANSNRCVENVGSGFFSPVSMFEGWRQSGGHNRNMLEQEVIRVGIAETGGYVAFFACN